ncbi:DUF4168 domain-containing protein [Nafulsella turpanensis]|uniref:DUF4168 domain-containing protein n=1 Tax=Nafulsella turpanensis TaxID=1265690 RepID=UPI000688559F|nr:DUF4168 domain-containing protein [Nafulsella turpanensis]
MKIKFLLSLAAALFMSGAAMAQVSAEQEQIKTDFSDDELEQFVDVYIKANEIRMENETVMMQAIEEEENIDLAKFNEILMARQQQQNISEIDATAEEMAAFNKAAQKIMEVQQEAQKEISQLIEEEIGQQTYQQIGMAYQQDPELQQEINQLLEEKVGKQE